MMVEKHEHIFFINLRFSSHRLLEPTVSSLIVSDLSCYILIVSMN